MANNGALYGIIGALGVVVAGGGLYIANQNGMLGQTTAPAPNSAPAAPGPVATAPSTPTATAPASNSPVVVVPPPAPSGPSAGQREQLRVLVTDARRAITRGDYNAADRALDQAERIDPRSADVIAARRDLRDAQQHANRDNRRVDGLVAQARAAIQRHDYAAADHLLDQAENIDSRDREVQQARAELNNAQRSDRPGPGTGRR